MTHDSSNTALTVLVLEAAFLLAAARAYEKFISQRLIGLCTLTFAGFPLFHARTLCGISSSRCQLIPVS